MTLGSLFDGIGGFPLAASRVGIVPAWASEIDKDCIVVTAKHFPDMVQLGDIKQLDGSELEPVDIITGGSPCQDLSVAGDRAGLSGGRSGLFHEMVRVIRKMRNGAGKPRYVLWEN
ncbi:MAG TPA: DNA cytosine methyltransferase, partial [Methanocella sp.]